MTTPLPNALQFDYVPYLHLSQAVPNRYMLIPLRPCEWTHTVGFLQGDESTHLRRMSTPYEHTWFEAHAQAVEGRPIEEVQVEVILQVRGLQDLVWLLTYLTALLLYDLAVQVHITRDLHIAQGLLHYLVQVIDLGVVSLYSIT